MKISDRGGIRKPYNIIDIVMTIQNMLFTDADVGLVTFVRKYNAECAAADRIIGRKAVALKLIFHDCPKETLNTILSHVGIMGWDDCCWTLETLSYKKIFPGHQFPSKSKQWVSRVKTTQDSFASHVRRMQTVHEKAPEYMRTKVDQAASEALAERASALHAVAKELQLQVPIGDGVLLHDYIEQWEQGNETIDKELQVALMDKSDNFDPALHLPTLKGLVDKNAMDAPVQGMGNSEKVAMELDSFNLLIRQLKYDQGAFEVWLAKCSTVQSAHHFKKQDFRLELKRQAMTGAKQLIHGCMNIVVWDEHGAETNIAEAMTYKKDLGTRLGCSTADIPQLTFLNRTSPCLTKEKLQNLQASLLTWALHENMQSCATVLMPVFTYNKSKLHLEKASLVTQMTKGNHNLDWEFFLAFKDRTDERDGRPMTYPGLFVYPSPLGVPSKSLWFNADLRKNGRTPDVPQLAGRDMKEIEDRI